MFNALLYLGLCGTSFAVLNGVDIREIKMTVALFFCVALGMAELFSGIKAVKNYWVLILCAFIPISIAMAPAPKIDMVGIQVSNFWSWYPFLKIILFSLLFFVISGHEFKEQEIRMVLRVILWCGILTSLYELTQFFYTDQLFKRVADGDWGRIGGFIGNPTLTAPFCAMIVPIGFYFKDWAKTAILIVGAIIPDSQTAWIALFIGVMVYLAMKGKKWFISMLSCFVLCVSLFIFLYSTNKTFREKLDDHERFYEWSQIFKDWTGPLAPKEGVNNNFSLTGRGIGSFQFVYHVQHPGINADCPNKFHQAHNDYLEFGYSCGFVAVGLLLMAIFFMVRRVFSFEIIRYHKALLASFSIIAVSAIGSFVFQIGTLAFYTVVICGLLHNERTICG